MDDKLTAISSSTVEQAVSVGSATETHGNLSEVFSKVFPAYLNMGMSYDEFYNKDHTLAADYRHIFKQKREKENFDMWLMGLYVYQAISRTAPLLIPFNEHPNPEPYLDKPLPIYDKVESAEEKKANAVAEKGMAYMKAKMIEINKRFGEG